METIKNYLESMFKALPQTEEIFRLKNELLSNMEEKYDELKSEGKTSAVLYSQLLEFYLVHSPVLTL